MLRCNNSPQIMKFSIKDFFSKCDQMRRKLRIWSYFLKKSLIDNLFFCAAHILLSKRVGCCCAKSDFAD